MMRSLFSAVSGLKSHQTMMDTIGNNIANVNTTGFKASQVTFSTMLSQTMKGSSAPTTTPVAQGGSNAAQIGLGSQIGAITKNMSQGSSQNTGVWSNMMIQGDGFFVLNNAGQTVYSRAGNFTTDSNGYLVDSATGAYVQGPPSATITGAEPGWGGTAGDYTYTNSALVGLAGVNITDVTDPANPSTLASLSPVTGAALTPGGANPDYTFDSTTGTIHFLNKPSSSSPISVQGLVKVTLPAVVSPATNTVTIPSLMGATTITDGTGTALTGAASSAANVGIDGDYYFDSATGKLTYDSTFNPATGTLTPVATNPNLGFILKPTKNIDIPPNTYTNLSVDKNGNITGTNSAGTVTNLGQVNLATFANSSGLTSIGNNYYVPSNNSGAAIVGAPNTGSAGSIVSNALEMSNVDLGQEMTNMIIAQRGFEANSRVITVTDTFLQTLVNLKQQ